MIVLIVNPKEIDAIYFVKLVDGVTFNMKKCKHEDFEWILDQDEDNMIYIGDDKVQVKIRCNNCNKTGYEILKIEKQEWNNE